MKVKEGQIWGNIDKEFKVVLIEQLEGNTWIHYVNEKTGQPYSCFEESFVTRFSQIVNR